MIGAGLFRRSRVSPIQFLMLLQLKEGPKYGYEILKALRKQFEGVWEPKTGSIYPALRRLEARGFVETEASGGRDFYGLTERGEDLFKRIGDRLGEDLKFADRYYKYVIRWMPRPMMNRVLEMLRMLADEEVWPPIFIERFVDDATEQADKLEALEIIRKLLRNRLRVVEGMMEDLKGGGES
jgi:DNA-binding PadR family transcriptional regulator